MKKFITILEGKFGPILEDTTWVKAQWQAYSIDENLKVIGYENVEIPDLNGLKIEDGSLITDNSSKPKDNRNESTKGN